MCLLALVQGAMSACIPSNLEHYDISPFYLDQYGDDMVLPSAAATAATAATATMVTPAATLLDDDDAMTAALDDMLDEILGYNDTLPSTPKRQKTADPALQSDATSPNGRLVGLMESPILSVMWGPPNPFNTEPLPSVNHQLINSFSIFGDMLLDGDPQPNNLMLPSVNHFPIPSANHWTNHFLIPPTNKRNFFTMVGDENADPRGAPFSTNPCKTDTVGINCVHQMSAGWLMTTALYGAGLLGYGAEVQEWMNTMEQGLCGWDALSSLLWYMREECIPLLVAAGYDTDRGDGTEELAMKEFKDTKFKFKFESGMPLLLVASNWLGLIRSKHRKSKHNVLALGMPMGSPKFVSSGDDDGFLDNSLRDPNSMHKSAIQFWVDLKAVGSGEHTRLDHWIKDDVADTFRFSVDKKKPEKENMKNYVGQGLHNKWFNGRFFTHRMFPHTTLSTLVDVLRNESISRTGSAKSYEESLAAYAGTAAKIPDKTPDVWWWRRALLLKIMADKDNRMRMCLSGIIPTEIIGEPTSVEVDRGPCKPANIFYEADITPNRVDMPSVSGILSMVEAAGLHEF